MHHNSAGINRQPVIRGVICAVVVHKSVRGDGTRASHGDFWLLMDHNPARGRPKRKFFPIKSAREFFSCQSR